MPSIAKSIRVLASSILVILSTVSCATARGGDVNMRVDWDAFLSRSDLVWTAMPTQWSEGGFTGNGLLGTIFWQEGNALYFEISRTDAYDHRNSASIYTGRYRMPNGNFTLDYKGAEPKGQMRLDLWDAEVRGAVKTDRGRIHIRTFTHAAQDVIFMEVTTAGSESLDLNWHPDICQTSRRQERGKTATTPYPPQTRQVVEGVHVSVQDMPESEKYNTQGRGVGQYATAWKVVEVGKGQYHVYISEAHSYPGAAAKQEAVDSVNRAAAMPLKDFVATHQRWWHDFYQKSFLSVPNSRLESFYWIQMYKMASATRGDGPIIDLAGPWYQRDSKWPGIWWNLNIQCTYAPFYVSNHNDLANSMIDWMVKYKDNIEANAGGDGRYAIGRSCPITLERSCSTRNYEFGDLGYALHNVWEQYRCTMDDQLLRDKLYPFMKGHFLFDMDHYIEKIDGKYHLKPSGSPEYTRQGYPPPPDCNYNLAILKWMMTAMVYADDRLKLNDPIIPLVKTVLANLTDYPANPKEGFMVGRDQPFAYSHRHWSHLFMVYPFYDYTYDEPVQGALIDKSLAHWLSYSEQYRGYSWLAAASMTAMKGDGDKAVEYIFKSMNHERFPTLPNTMYLEGAPVIETPLLGARTIQDLILTSYKGIIRVFPGAPESWPNMAFHDLRAEGAFLVSARRERGSTQFVRIASLAGEPCRVKAGMSGSIKASGNRAFNVTDLGNGVVEIDLHKDESVILHTGELPALEIDSVPVMDPTNYWGTITDGQKSLTESGI